MEKGKNKFEKLSVLKAAHTLVLSIYKITRRFPKEEMYSLTNQMRRSAVSIPANIIEGNERNSHKEYIQFLYISKGSLSETEYYLYLSHDLSYIDGTDYKKLLDQTSEVGKMLNSLIRYVRTLL